ncbi:MAG TPA: cytochrome c-type biogenesis protein CcmH [Bryobacteraceae bacterium]|nr:cytochrome c-type biogenesis protein CcmH [Bryobacteraceae bacterium]
MRNLVCFALLLTIACAAQAALPPLETKLQHELLAPCCYRETLDHHMSQEAYTMRAEIHQMVLSGKSERQIIDFYKARYGMRILGEPEGVYWWIGILTPFAVLALGLIGLILMLRKWSRSSRAQAAT